MTHKNDWLAHWNLYSPNALALEDGETTRSFTYQQLYFKSCQLAWYLKRHFDIGIGDRIVLLAQNELESILLFFATQRLGACLVPVNFRLTGREIDHIVDDCDPKLVVTQSEYLPLINGLSQKKFQLELLTGLNSLSEKAFTTDGNQNYFDFHGQDEDMAMIIYTSGTTGNPKGAVITNNQLFWNSINTTMRLNIVQSDSAVIFLPLFHTGGWNVLTTPFLHRGAKVILIKKFSPELVLKLTSEKKCSLLFGVPTTMDMIARCQDFHQTDLSSLRYAIVGGEPMPVELIKTWHKKGVPIRQGYGLTEFGPNVFSLNEEDSLKKIGSIGFPNFYINTKIVDDRGNEVLSDTVGELLLKGPVCMKEYWKNPKATQETIVDGWLATGDLVRKDADGYFYVVGRKKDMYKSGGENVYPVEIEQIIGAIPGVREVAVIGTADDKWGEVGKAFVSIDSESKIDESVLRTHCEKNLAKFKIPKYFQFVDSLPKGDSGKILKKSLRELA